jgi:hypothetical protein
MDNERYFFHNDTDTYNDMLLPQYGMQGYIEMLLPQYHGYKEMLLPQ